MNKPILSKRAFQNVDMDKIDFESDVLNILERLMYRGTLDDFNVARDFYGDKKIREVIVSTKCFGPKEVHFCCRTFNLKVTDFIHYKQGQFRAYPEFKNCPDDFEYLDYAAKILRTA